MAPRAISSATVSFGLVAIPVKVYSTTKSTETVRFNQIHEECGSRLKQKMWCPQCEKEVGRDETVKGYEFAKNQYVLFDREELKALEKEAERAIEIQEFVQIEQVDPIYFDKAYFLGPDKGGDKPYRLLARVLRETGQAAVGKWATRGKQYVVIIRPDQDEEDGLVMHQMRYADEIRSIDELELPTGEVKEEEIDLARKVVEQLASEAFSTEEYEDEVKLRILEAVEQKIEGKEVTAAPAEAEQAEVIDLMDALKKSLAQTERKPAKQAKSANEKSQKKTKKKKSRKTSSSKK